MASYERINWENFPSKETPLDADNLNYMDETIYTLVRELAYVRTIVASNKDTADSLEARIAQLSTLVDGSTTGDAELIDGRVGYDGTTYASIGNAIRGQINTILTEIRDGRIGYDGSTYASLGEALRTQIAAAMNDITEISSGLTGTVEELTSKVRDLELGMLKKVDDAYVAEGYLYMTADGEVVVGPLGPFSGSGGGGGGEDTNAAKLTVTNLTGWLSKLMSYGESCRITVDWSSIEDEMPTGDGTATVIVNGVSKLVRSVQQGNVTIDIAPYLGTGSNSVRFKITDVYGNARTINFSISMVALTLTSSFDPSSPFQSSITFPYVPSGNVEKTVHFIVDGTEIGTATTTVSGRQLTYVIPQQSHGAHSLRVYFDAAIEGQEVVSNELYYDLICIDPTSTVPIIASPFASASTTQYSLLPINYYVYTPNQLTSDVTLKANGQTVATLTVDRTQQTWSYRVLSVGELTLQIVSGSASKTFVLEAGESDVTARAETQDLALYLTSEGRSNNEAHPETWSYNDISATLTGFNFSSDGWVQDEDVNTVLRVTGNARVTIPYQIFANDFRGTGKTIEFEFATRDVRDYDAVILSCWSENRGIKLTPQKMTIKSEQSELDVQYKEDEHVRVSFVIQKRSENRLLFCYLNGIISAVTQYPDADDFQQITPVGISIGSSDCTTDIYNIRVYDNNLTRYQMLDNWIADTPNVDTMLSRYRHNNVFDEYGQIVISKLPNDLPYLILEGPTLPQFKGDKKTMSGSYTNPLDNSKSFTFTGAQVDVQGTSSQYYPRKNYKIKFKNGFVINGSQGDNYAINSSAIPTNTFTFKADVASSEGANNVELARLYNDACPYKTSAQVENAKIRQGIDGFPIVIFWNNGTDTVFIGKYNFNNDKGTPEVFGFVEGDESWEIKNNTSDRVIWKNADYSGSAWLDDFEARYPDEDPAYEDPTQLAEFASFLVSTDRTQATGNALPATVTYNGVTYTSDTAEYRLAKFKAEIGDYTELQSAMFYYLFTELFLMVDSRAKNAFPSFMGGVLSD